MLIIIEGKRKEKKKREVIQVRNHQYLFGSTLVNTLIPSSATSSTDVSSDLDTQVSKKNEKQELEATERR